MTKRCSDCRVEKPLDSFHSSGKGHRTNCKVCRSVRDRSDKLRRLYNITPDHYISLLASQGGSCNICNQQETRRDKRTGSIRFLAVDHDHSCCPGIKSCGRCIRSLLCSRCNILIGMADDNADFLKDCITYLDNWRENEKSRELARRGWED